MENKAKDLNKALKELEVSKEYFSLKEKINKDEYSKKLLEVIKQTQNDKKRHLKNNHIQSNKASKQILDL